MAESTTEQDDAMQTLASTLLRVAAGVQKAKLVRQKNPESDDAHERFEQKLEEELDAIGIPGKNFDHKLLQLDHEIVREGN